MRFSHYYKDSTVSTSTLIPYTTLFRSGRPGLVRAPAPAMGHRRNVDHWRRGGLGRDQSGRRDRLIASDRKSTRLNSSHVKISYAVFCLKKKHLRKSLLDQKHAVVVV